MSAGADFPRPDESCRLADGRLAQAAIARWYDVRLRATHGILIALDMESLDRMRKVVEQTSGISGVVGYKVGLTVTLRLGLGGAVRHLRASTDLPLSPLTLSRPPGRQVAPCRQLPQIGQRDIGLGGLLGRRHVLAAGLDIGGQNASPHSRHDSQPGAASRVPRAIV